MRPILAALLYLLGALAATAQDDEDSRLMDAANCALTSDSLARLTCFDRVFPKGSSPAAAVEPRQGKWVIETDRSSLDDSLKVTAALDPTDSSATGIYSDTVLLAVRCIENTTSIVLTIPMFVINDRVSVTYRIGDAPPVTERWSRATNMRAIGLWAGNQSIPFLRSLPDNTKLFVRVSDRERADIEFDLSNVSEVRAQVASACNWTP